MFVLDGKNTNSKVREAIKIANNSTYKRNLTVKLSNVDSYDMTDAKPDYIKRKVFAVLNNNKIYVVIYYPVNRWSKAIAYYSSSKPYNINLNGYKLNRSVNSIIGTLYHELTHLADNFDVVYDYGHADNSPNGKQDTAPYKIGNIAKEVSYSFYKSDPVKTYTPWYKRLFRWLF